MKGCYHGIGKPDGVLIVFEGYATGASIHEATGQAVALAFNAGNLEAVALDLHRLIQAAGPDRAQTAHEELALQARGIGAVGGVDMVEDTGLAALDAEPLLAAVPEAQLGATGRARRVGDGGAHGALCSLRLDLQRTLGSCARGDEQAQERGRPGGTRLLYR